jgi:cytochrome c
MMGGAAAVALLALLAACSPAEQKSEAPPAAPTEAAAPPAPVEPTVPAADAVLLDIKDASGAQLSGDVTRGTRVFRQCMTCHVTTAGMNKVGPSLHAIVGRKAGTVPGFRYSDANKNSGITWTEQELYVYLENPRAKVPGTTMSFVGLRDSQQRADVIAYLQETTK